MCKQREREALPAPRAHSLATRAVPNGMSAPGARSVRAPGGFGPAALLLLTPLAGIVRGRGWSCWRPGSLQTPQ